MKQSLDGEWSLVSLPLESSGCPGYEELSHTDRERLTARVPGEVHLDLMRAGLMGDPNVGDNARTSCRWPEEYSWWYHTEFTLRPEECRALRQGLIFEGIDLFGQVFVNGALVGESRNAFAPASFDVKPYVHAGRNELVVRVTSGLELAPPPDGTPNVRFGGPLYDVRSTHQRKFLRKPAYAFGWDWCDPLPNIGIWRSVKLVCQDGVVIDRLRLDTRVSGDDVFLDGEIALDNLHPWSESKVTVELRALSPDGVTSNETLRISARPGYSVTPCRIKIREPQLWWPNEMGEQPLYRVSARVTCEDGETDELVQTIGLRTLALDRSPSQGGSRFCFKVNGEDVFCKGGNWAPADLIPARLDRERYRQLIDDARDAHFTMLRVNGTGLYESDDFYDFCDEAGILVWQDFAFSCGEYAEDPALLASISAEAEAAVRRLRHHPSLALWCANNEIAMLMADFWESDPTTGHRLEGIRIYNEVLPTICHALDPVRSYWVGSPSGGAHPQSPTSGDVHGWVGQQAGYVRRGMDHVGARWREVADESRGRFYSETFSFFAPPHLSSIRAYLAPDELSPESRTWQIHTNAMEAGGLAGSDIAPAVPGGFLFAGIRYHYGEPESLELEELVLYGQMFQALLQGSAIEAARFRKHDPTSECQGALTWSYNETWGEVGWSIIDHYARRRASYYAVRRGAAPIKVLVRSQEGSLVTRVVNDTLETYRDVVIRNGWMRLDGESSSFTDHIVSIPANSMIEVARTPLSASTERDPREWMYAATLDGKDVKPDQAIWTLAPFRDLALAEPVISTVERDGMLEVTSTVFCHGVHLDDDGREVLADNYFDLLPLVTKAIPITASTPDGVYDLSAVMPIGRGSA